MAKKKTQKHHRECLGSCFECDKANYICEGDFLCDAYDESPVVISDWLPTRDYFKCNGKYYEPV